jgi:bacterioferritin (cytochrome b1)
MAGASAGGLAGPAGAAIGAAVGAVAGAIGGKAIASRISPDAEEEHWRKNYSTQPYVTSGSRYEDYGPAYRLGYERYPEYHGRSFEEAEIDLQRDWESRRGESRLAWNDAKHATRDAFNRVRNSVAVAATGTTGAVATSSDVADELNKLLRGELAATETYRQALDKIRDQYGHDATFQQLAEIHRDHEDAAGHLRSLVQQAGGVPSNDSGAWGTWASTVMGAARVLGDRAALSALASGEKSGVEDYVDALKHDEFPDAVRHSVRALLARNQEHVQQLDQMIEAT